MCVCDLEETRADAVRKAMQVEECQEVDCPELAVDCGRARQARGDFKVGAEKPRRTRLCD